MFLKPLGHFVQYQHGWSCLVTKHFLFGQDLILALIRASLINTRPCYSNSILCYIFFSASRSRTQNKVEKKAASKETATAQAKEETACVKTGLLYSS